MISQNSNDEQAKNTVLGVITKERIFLFALIISRIYGFTFLALGISWIIGFFISFGLIRYSLYLTRLNPFGYLLQGFV